MRMAEFFTALTDDHRAFIARQPLFFVAEGRLNLSPKRYDAVRVLAPERLARIADRTRSIDGLPVRVQTIIPAFDA